MLALCVVALTVMGFAGAGCGDDGSGESTAKEPTIPVANEPPSRFMKRTAKLLATTTAPKQCAQLLGVNGQSIIRFDCPAAKSLRKSMESFQLVGSKMYGTGAVIDYKSGELEDGAAILLFVSPNRGWGISRFGILTRPSTKTSDEDSRAGYDRAVDDYLTAIRERDCDAFQRVAYISEENSRDFCEKSFRNTKPLSKRLKANPSYKTKYEGGNGTFGFYGFETAKPEPANFTISVVSSGSAYQVLDVAPSPTAAKIRETNREFRRQLREQRKAKTMGPSTNSDSPKPLPPADN